MDAGYSASLFDAVFSTLRAIGAAFATYVPDVVAIAVIVVVTRYIIKLIALIFTGIERGAISFAGFHRDWAEPTYKIVRFLVIVFAAIACFPYIPGSKSEGFRGSRCSSACSFRSDRPPRSATSSPASS